MHISSFNGSDPVRETFSLLCCGNRDLVSFRFLDQNIQLLSSKLQLLWSLCAMQLKELDWFFLLITRYMCMVKKEQKDIQ